MNLHDTMKALEQGKFDTCLKALYACDDCTPYRTRFLNAVKAFQEEFSADDSTEIALFSAPGRTELGGNHTDHQGGHVLAGSVNTDIIAVASKQNNYEIRLKSEGMNPDFVDLSDLSPQEDELNTSSALLRGIASKFTEMGYPVTGFNAYTTSDILRGSGLSSSAGFEVLTGTICSAFFADSQVSAVEIAKIGQYAENVYFGKPCGLMDQMACAYGGIIAIDFKSEEPEITQVSVDLQKEGYALCIIDTGADHADLTDAYASIPAEMSNIAKMFSKEKLSEITEAEFMSHLAGFRRTCGDRAVLRAMHYFADDKRVSRQVQALQNGDFEAYLAEVRASGLSSFRYLQNVSVYDNPEKQEVAVTIALCEHILNGQGAVRVHGGGFAGTVQAYVPLHLVKDFKMQIETYLGVDRCHVFQIRSLGSVALTAES